MRRDAGLSLIELVVAMALFALVAVMGLQVLNGTLRFQSRYVALSDQTAELSLALTLLRRDLAHAVPMPFVRPEGGPLSSIEMTLPGPVLALSLAGQPSLGETGDDGTRRVEWRHDPRLQTLSRRSWPTLMPQSASQVASEEVILSGVRRLDMRVFQDGLGWQNWSELPTNQLSLALPDAIEVTLDLTGIGLVPLVEVYR